MPALFPKELKRRTTNPQIVRTIEMNLGKNHSQTVYALVQKQKFITADNTLTEQITDALLLPVEKIAPSKKVKLVIHSKLNIHPSVWNGFLDQADNIELIQIYNKG